MSEGDFHCSICDDGGRATFKKTVGKDPDVKKSGLKGVRAMYTVLGPHLCSIVCTCVKE